MWEKNQKLSWGNLVKDLLLFHSFYFFNPSNGGEREGVSNGWTLG